LPLNQLEQVVADTFSAVPRAKKDPVDISGSLTSKDQIGQIIFIKPIKNRQSVTLSWELPLELAQDPTQSAEILAYALKRGQKYSLYEKLKKEGLIDTMSVKVEELGGLSHRFFQISLELTKKGLEEVDTAIFRCFQALAGATKTGIPAYLFHEKNKMAEIRYQYQERQNPFSYVSYIGSAMADEPLSSFPRQQILASEYSPKKITEVLAQLTPKTLAISILASPELTKALPNLREKWLGAEYTIQPIPKNWMASWNKALPHKEILLASPNPFLPENLSLAPVESSIPALIASSDLGTAYYVRSPEFGVPESIYHVHIKTEQITPSAKSAVLASLYIDHLTDVIHPTLAEASAAGLRCSLNLDRSAIHLEISGFSEKAPLLLQEVVKQMPLNPPTEEQFAIYIDRHEKTYLNSQKELAALQAKELLDSLVNQERATKQEKLQALRTINYEEFLKFHEQLFENTYCEALFAGNLSVKEAESAWIDIIHAIGKAPFPKEKHFSTQILRLSEKEGPYQIRENTDVQGNATLLLVDQGDFTHKKRAAQAVLSATLKEAFFNELRTKQKTGYIAQSDAVEVEERLFQYFVVQSNSHQPEELLFRFEQFIETFNDSLSEHISEKRFATLKEGIIASLQTRFRNLGSKAALWDNLAFERDANFTFIEHRIQSLQALNYADFLDQAQKFLSRENRKRLAILFEGKLASPFAYQPIGLPQIGEIANYAPKSKKPLEDSADVLWE
jgi:insulysin